MVAEDIAALKDTAEQIAERIDLQIAGWVLVDSVRVKGNQRIETEAILAVIRTRGGDKLDPDLLDRDLRDIYRMGFFDDIVIEIRGGCLVGVYSDNRDQRFILLDWDDLNESPKAVSNKGLFPTTLYSEMPDDTRCAYEHSVTGQPGESQ